MYLNVTATIIYSQMTILCLDHLRGRNCLQRLLDQPVSKSHSMILLNQFSLCGCSRQKKRLAADCLFAHATNYCLGKMFENR